MSEQTKLIIRDGTQPDIAKCKQLDSSYRTDYVWQLHVREDIDETTLTLRKQRLPRPMDSVHQTDERRLDITLKQKYCFIVLVESPSETHLGYISMRVDPIYQIAYLQDIVIDYAFRRQGLGSRLLHVAKLWATEKKLKTLMFEIPTTNFPCIEFAKSHGFILSGYNDHYLPNQEIAIYFALSL